MMSIGKLDDDCDGGGVANEEEGDGDEERRKGKWLHSE